MTASSAKRLGFPWMNFMASRRATCPISISGRCVIVSTYGVNVPPWSMKVTPVASGLLDFQRSTPALFVVITGSPNAA
jgi:hypothetical protein